MFKKTIWGCFCLSILLFSNVSQAQSKQIDKAAKKVAKGLCDCLNKNLSDIDSDALDMLTVMLSKESEEESIAYFESLDAEMQAKIGAGIDQLGKADEQMTSCLDDSNLKPIIKKAADTNEIAFEDFMALTVKKLSSMKKCKTVYALFGSNL